MKILVVGLFVCFWLSMSDGQSYSMTSIKTAPGNYWFSSISTNVKANYKVPTTVTSRSANGDLVTTETSNVKIIALQGTTFDYSVACGGSFENCNSGLSGWITDDTVMTLDRTIGAAGTATSIKITGDEAGAYDYGARAIWAGSPVVPVLVSYYVRVNKVDRSLAYFSLRDSKDGDVRSIITIAAHDGFLRAYRKTGDDTIWGDAAIIGANTWYKVDIQIDWPTKTFYWFLNGQFIDHFPFDKDDAVNLKRIDLLNVDSGGTSWFDEIRVIGATAYTTVAVSPNTIPLSQGTWNGTLTITGTNFNSLLPTFFQAYRTSGSNYYSGYSSEFTTLAACTIGNYAADYSSSCSPCPLGEFSNITAATSCTPCFPGTWNGQQGQTSCSLCPNATYNPAYGARDLSSCIACAYNVPPGSIVCASCPLGQFRNNTVCQNCTIGTYGLGDAVCHACPAGTYNPAISQSTCSNCLAGTYNPLNGSTSVSACQPCPAGYFTDSGGNPSCSKCPTGYYSAPDATGCSPCPATKYLVNNTCVSCSPGSFNADPASEFCTKCDIGSFARGYGSSACQVCEPGFAASSLGSTFCSGCEPGFYSNNNGSSSCTLCSAGYYTNTTNQTTCLPCPEGFESSENRTDCVPCPIFTYNNQSGGVCIPCPSNYSTYDLGSTSCTFMCGNGLIELAEQCDDGNELSDDGCSMDCVLEAGYTCPIPGQPCQKIPDPPPPIEVRPTPSRAASGSDLGLIIGLAVGGSVVFILAAVMVTALILRNRRNKKKLEIELTNLKSASLEEALPSPKPARQITGLIVQGKVGGGNFGEVYRGTWGISDVALKKLKDEDYEDFEKEANTLQELSHPNIVQFFGIWTSDTGEHYIVTEFLSKGSLLNLLQSDERKSVDQAELVSMARDTAAGLAYLHGVKIIHCDLALRNLLVAKSTSDDSKYLVKGKYLRMSWRSQWLTLRLYYPIQSRAWSVALITNWHLVADFGLSKSVDLTAPESESPQAKLPIKWTAIEVLKHGKFSFKSDVWSFGVTLWEIYSFGLQPYPGMSNSEAVSQISKGHRLARPTDCPAEMYEIMLQCWKENPEDRPDMKAIAEQIHTIWSKIHQVSTPVEQAPKKTELPEYQGPSYGLSHVYENSKI